MCVLQVKVKANLVAVDALVSWTPEHLQLQCWSILANLNWGYTCITSEVGVSYVGGSTHWSIQGCLTHSVLVTHISVIVVIVSGNGMSPVLQEAISWTNTLYWNLRNKLKWNLIQNMVIFYPEKCILKYHLWNDSHFGLAKNRWPSGRRLGLSNKHTCCTSNQFLNSSVLNVP